MTLREWRKWKGLSLRAAGERFGWSHAYISQLEDADDIRMSTADHIERLTDGLVTRLDWPKEEE